MEDERLALYPVEAEDVEQLRDIVNDPAIRIPVMNRRPYSLADEEDWFEEQRTDDDQVNFAVYHTGDGQLIGNVGLEMTDTASRVASIGYFIDTDYHSEGYGTEAVQMLVEYVFNELNMHRLWARVQAGNDKSIGLLEKLGFEQEAELREHGYVDGAYRDILIMGLLRDEY